MGKMIDAQSIVVASTATRWYGHEGSILRYVFFHSIALAVLVGLLVMAQAYVAPFTPSGAAAAAGRRRGAGRVSRLGKSVKPVVTLTVNPAIDAACVADEVVPMRKVRTRDERYDAGGGGINVARMIRELGGETVAFYLAGGITGQSLEGLVERCGLAAVRVPIAEMTRVSHTVYETSTGQEFRFTPKAPRSARPSGSNCLEVLSVVDSDYFVSSGSLARGLPPDFYAEVARMVKARGGRVVIDSSGTALHLALEEGVHLVKPSRGELERLLGRKATSAGRGRGAGARGGRHRPRRDRGPDAGRRRCRAGDARRRVPPARPPRSRRAAPSAPATASSAPWCGRWRTACGGGGVRLRRGRRRRHGDGARNRAGPPRGHRAALRRHQRIEESDVPHLAMVRHGESDWNLREPLHRLGRRRPVGDRVGAGAKAGELLRAERVEFDQAFTSVLKRAIRTLVDRARRPGPDVAAADHELAAERAPLRRPAGPEQGRDRGEARRRAGQDLAPQLRRPAAAAGARRPDAPQPRPALSGRAGPTCCLPPNP